MQYSLGNWLRPTKPISYTLLNQMLIAVSFSGQPRGPSLIRKQQNSVQVSTPSTQLCCSSAPVHETAARSTAVLLLMAKTSCCSRCSCLRSHCLLDWALAVLDAGDGCRETAGGTAADSQHMYESAAHCCQLFQ